MQYIKIHSLDNVAVALADLTEGTEVTFNNQSLTLRQAVGRGHKFALIPIAKGENVVKYGLPIGHALADIAPGEYIHSHNTRTNLSDLDEYSYQPDFQSEEEQAADPQRAVDPSNRRLRERHCTPDPDAFSERDTRCRGYRRRTSLQPYLRLFAARRRPYQHPHHAAKHGAPP